MNGNYGVQNENGKKRENSEKKDNLKHTKENSREIKSIKILDNLTLNQAIL